MTGPDRGRARSFNDVAGLYDATRAGYPETVFDDVVRLAGLGPDDRLLEVGCGTGRATLPMARRGFAIVAIEPGDALAAIATERTQEFPDVRVETVSFEEWRRGDVTFDLLFAAQVFHWIDPEAGLAKAAEAVRAGGAVALIWTVDVSQHTDLWRATQPVYDTYMPDAADKPPRTLPHWVARYTEALGTHAAFGDVTTCRHPWTRAFTTDEFHRFLQTHSPVRALDPGQRAGFLAAMADELAAHGDPVERHYETVLLFAHRV